MKSLWRRLEKKFPYGISAPSSKETNILLYSGSLVLAIALAFFYPLTVTSVVPGLVALGIILPLGAISIFLLSKLFARRHQKVGEFFGSHMKVVETSLNTAQERLKKHGLAKDSEPGVLLEEARQLFSQTVFAAVQTHQDLRKFEKQYSVYFKNINWTPVYEGKNVVSRPLKGVPAEMVVETAHIIRSFAPLRDFMTVFNSSLETALEQSSGHTSRQGLAQASSDFKGKLEKLSERARYDKAARVDLDKMFEEDSNPAPVTPELPMLKKQPQHSLAKKQPLQGKSS